MYIENCITGLDFDLSGKLVATIDKKGVCLISNVDTDEYNFHLEMGDAGNLTLKYSLFSQ